MNRSTKFGFYLPQNTDPISVSDFNYNFDVIDDNLITESQSFTSTQKETARTNIGAASEDDIDALETSMSQILHYKDKTFSSVAVGNSYYKELGNFYNDVGLPNGSYIIGYYIRGWSGDVAAYSLASGSNGNSLYLLSSNKNVTISSITVRVIYTSGDYISQGT